jgi:predicted transcriptional regulator
VANDGWMSAPEIAKELGATEYSVNRALSMLGLAKEGKRDISDRRRMIYPPGSTEKVKVWLESN